MMTPKSLLRHKLAVSPVADMAEGTHFLPVIGEVDPIAEPEAVTRVVICSGKVYYDLLAERREQKADTVALLRLEQIYPFSDYELGEALKPYVNARVIWCQEEPENMGSWSFVDRRIEAVLGAIGHKSARPIYVGRRAAASPATGLARTHASEQATLVRQALDLDGASA